MKSEWMIYTRETLTDKYYVVYRMVNRNKPDLPGNREVYDTYDTYDEAAKKADDLNWEEEKKHHENQD